MRRQGIEVLNFTTICNCVQPVVVGGRIASVQAAHILFFAAASKQPTPPQPNRMTSGWCLCKLPFVMSTSIWQSTSSCIEFRLNLDKRVRVDQMDRIGVARQRALERLRICTASLGAINAGAMSRFVVRTPAPQLHRIRGDLFPVKERPGAWAAFQACILEFLCLTKADPGW